MYIKCTVSFIRQNNLMFVFNWKEWKNNNKYVLSVPHLLRVLQIICTVHYFTFILRPFRFIKFIHKKKWHSFLLGGFMYSHIFQVIYVPVAFASAFVENKCKHSPVYESFWIFVNTFWHFCNVHALANICAHLWFVTIVRMHSEHSEKINPPRLFE